MTLEIKDKGVFRVENNAEHLQMWTESGWRLVAVLEEQDTMSVTDQVLTGPPQQYMGSAYGQPSQYANVTKYLPHTFNRYLLLKDEDTVITELRNDLKTAQERLGKESQDFNAFKKQVEVDLKAYELLQGQSKTVAADYLRVVQEFKEYRAEAELKSKEDADKLKEAAIAIEKYATIRKTAYERILEGEFDERIEGIEAGDFGDRRDPVADVPEGSGLHP